MTNVSKQPLNKKLQKQLFDQFVQLLALTSQGEANGLYYELFTPSERIMFVKRIAVIAMLSRGHSPYRIAATLHMSDTTVSKLLERYERNQFHTIEKLLRQKKFDHETFWNVIGLLLTAGMPPQGKGRWKTFYTINS